MQKFKIGDKVKVIGNTNHHGSSIGDVLTIKKSDGITYTVKETGWAYKPQDLELCILTKHELEEKIHKLNTLVETLKAKIAYLEEVGLDQFDDSEYKVYKALKTLETSDSLINKAKVIAELIK